MTLREKYRGTHFPLDGITDLNGKPVTRKTFRNKEHTVVDFWYVGCAPCIREMKKFNSHLEDNPNLQIISVNIDDLTTLKRLLVGNGNELAKSYPEEASSDDAHKKKNNSSALAFLADGHDNWHHLNKMNTDKAWNSGHNLDVEGYPTYFLVNSEGLILDRFNTFDEYFYTSFQKKLRDKAGFLFFLSTNSELVKAGVSSFFLIYFVGSLLFFGIKKLVRSRQPI